jgi:hypothetical protein
MKDLPVTVHQPNWDEMSPLFRKLVRRYSCAFIQNIWHLNEETARDVAAIKDSLIPPVKYAAVQIRRGDKMKWGQIQRVPAERIVKAIPEDAEVLWVATDDYSAVEELRSLYPRPVLTSCLPAHRGSDTLSHHFLEGEAPQLRAETLRLLADLESCRTADWFLRILPHRKLSQNGYSRNLQIADMISDLRFGKDEVPLL